MAMMTGSQYLASLDDGRRIFAEGEEVKDLANHPQFATAIRLVEEGYNRHYQSGDDANGPYFTIPRSKDDLHSILKDLLHWDMVTVTTSQGLLALLTAAARMRGEHPEYAQRIEAYFEYCLRNDLRCVQAITDAKGDRARPPCQQSDEDAHSGVVAVR